MDSQQFYVQVSSAIAQYLYQELQLRPNFHYLIKNATSGPRVLTLAVNINPSYAKRITAMAEPLSMAAKLDAGTSIRISRGSRGMLALEIPKPHSLWFNIGVGNLPGRRGLLTNLGLDMELRPIGINFNNPLTPHILIAGATGCGKTYLLRLVAFLLAKQNTPNNAKFLFVDTQKRECWNSPKDGIDLSKLPHLLHPIIGDEETALKAMMWLMAEMDRRAERGKTAPAIFLFIDEVQALLSNPAFAKLLSKVAQFGRGLNVHATAGLQRPTAENMGGTADLRSNMVCRLIGKVDSANSAYHATGRGGSGAEMLLRSGDFLRISPEGDRRLTAALLTQKDIEQLPLNGDNPMYLDFSDLEDVDHVIEQVQAAQRVGRPADDLEAAHVALALKMPDVSQRELNRRFSIGFPKAKRVLESAAKLRAELRAIGCHIACNEIAQRNGLTA